MLRSFPRLASTVPLLIASFVFPTSVAAQVPDPVVAAQAPQPGSDHGYLGRGAETVNPADGQVTFDLPIQTPPGRQLNFPFGIRYSHAETYAMGGGGNGVFGWQPTPVPWWGVGGWSWDLPNLTWRSVVQSAGMACTSQGEGGCQQWSPYQFDQATDFIFRGLTGQQYTLMLGGGAWPDQDPRLCSPQLSQCTTNSGGGSITPSTLHGINASFASQGQHSWPTGPAVTVTNQAGTVYQFPPVSAIGAEVNGDCCAAGALASSITNRNGNTITLNSPAASYTDTVGRQVVSWTGPSGTSPDTIAISGLPGSITVKWTTVPTSNYSMSYGLLSGNQNPNCQVPRSGPASSQPGVSEIDLPNSTKYTFSYNSTYGTIASIGFPDGGSVRYNWGLDYNSQGIFQEVLFQGENGDNQPIQIQEWCAISYDAPAVLERIVNDGTRDVLDQTFTYTPTTWATTTWTSKQTTVKTTDLVTGQVTYTVYAYSPALTDNPPLDTGSISPVAPVETSTVYENGSGSALQTVNQEWLNYMTESGGQTVLDNGQTRTTLKCFDSNEQVTQLNEFGLQSEGGAGSPPACYAYQVGGPLSAMGPLERQTVTVTSLNGSCNTNIVDEPCSITVEDGSGHTAKQTVFYYTDSVQSSGATCGTCLAGPPGAHRGNILSVARWLNTNNSWLTTNYAWFDTGQVLSMTDPNLKVTSYCYGDTTPGCPTGTTSGYLTQVTYPNTGVAHTGKFSWFLASGRLASSIDQNGQSTSYHYNDSLDRLTEIDYPCTPAGCGKTIISYNDSAPSPSMKVSKLLSGGAYATTEGIRDGLGHVLQSQLQTDPDGTDFTYTTYDGAGRVYTVSNPTRSGGLPSDGTTTYLYDALGRVCVVIPPYGTTVSTCPATPQTGDVFTSYSGACATVTDQQGKARQSCSDGLGRVAQVTEDPGGLGYLTSYQYDALDNLLTATLPSTGFSHQTRSFVYDSLSRLTSASNPETFGCGPSYTYDANGNVSTRTAPKPNQSPGGGGCNTWPTVNTTYNYDALNRLTSKSYNDGLTPTATFGYDESNLAFGSTNCSSTTYPIGRLTHTSTASNRTVTFNCYDAMGRTAQLYQCTPAKCSTGTLYSTQYGYDLAGDLTSEVRPVWFNPPLDQVTLTYNVGGAQRVTSISSSYIDSNHDGPVAQSITYTPWGAVNTQVSGCVGSGCVVRQETYAFNKRMQPVLMELGQYQGNLSNDYCVVYNYYSDVSNPFGSPPQCATPPTGSKNNGDAMGFFYQDNNASSLSHTQAYGYDGVNRLQSALAQTPTSTPTILWSQTYSYDPYGNGTCSGSGFCTAISYNSNSNQMTQIGTTAISYDAAGNQTSDPTGYPNHTYQWDPEGKMISVDGSATSQCASGATACYTINGLGQRVEEDLSGGSTQLETLFDLNGDELGMCAGGIDNGGRCWDSSYIRLGARIIAYMDLYGTWDVHRNTMGTTEMVTGHDGSTDGDQTLYPWGQSWNYTGTHQDGLFFAGFQNVEPPDFYIWLNPTLNRKYNSSLYRWLTPDPGGEKVVTLTDPQTWNMYAYVRNNPTTLTDPSGLDPQQAEGGCTNADADKCRQNQVSTQTKPSIWSLLRAFFSPDADKALKSQLGGEILKQAIGMLLGNTEIQNPANAGQITNTINLPSTITIPMNVITALAHIDDTGTAVPGSSGGGKFRNDGSGNGEILPKADAQGNAITYTKWDVNPQGAAPTRDAQRIVTGSDGSAYYTDDHYQKFIKIR